MRPVYLDYNATTPIAPSVLEAMMPFLTEHYGNPSSSHPLGMAAHQAIEDARERVAGLLGADVDEIFFTSGGTESNNLAILGAMLEDHEFSGHLVVSGIEHPAVLEPARFVERSGCGLAIVPPDRWGRIDPQQVHDAIEDDTVLVSIMHANNEIGTVQSIREIATVCHDRGVLLHTDAAQSVGKMRTNVEDLGVDMLTLAGHKMYAPKGIGVLYVRQGTSLQPISHGAGHEHGLRPGTENVAAIVGLGQASMLALRGIDEIEPRLTRLRDMLWHQLREGVGDRLTYNGAPDQRLPNTLSVNFPGVAGRELLDRAADVYASTGSACHSGATHLSTTLAAIGLAPDLARGTVRLSVGWTTSEEEVERAANSLLSAWDGLT